MRRLFLLPTGMANLLSLIMKLAVPVFLSPSLWMKQLAIRLSCQRPQPSRWLSRREGGTKARYASFTLILLLTGCASAPSTSQPQPVARPAIFDSSASAQNPFVLIGRISVKLDGKRSSANIRWTHSAETDEILLLGPLGQTVARIHNDELEFILDTAEKRYTAQSTEELTQQVLGWRLPMAGLRYWVLALPEPKSKVSIKRNENGQISILQQDGWNIHYTRYAAQTPDSLPLRISLQREEMELQLLIDEWEIP
jgi:outer membrane lipoprotein LolB